MKPQKFDFIGSDGGYLDPDGDEEMVRYRQYWNAGLWYARVAMSFERFIRAVSETLMPVMQRFAEALAELAPILQQLDLSDPKAEARQRSRDDLNRKRKEMMKRRGRK